MFSHNCCVDQLNLQIKALNVRLAERFTIIARLSAHYHGCQPVFCVWKFTAAVTGTGENVAKPVNRQTVKVVQQI